jgi:deoxyribodipyrimidine photo-lyase
MGQGLSIPAERIRVPAPNPVAAGGEYVLYWMTAYRRTSWNFALDRAVQWARELQRPLLLLEAVRSGHRWASDRHHRFLLDGMRDNRDRLSAQTVAYYPYVEPARGAGRGLLPALAAKACLVVTDDFPAFFLPRMLEAAARRVECRVEAVDSNGIVPMWTTDRLYPSAFHFRRFLQKELPTCIAHMPSAHPFEGAALPELEGLPSDVVARWPQSDLREPNAILSAIPIDHDVTETGVTGGESAGRRVLVEFIDRRLARYGNRRNHPDSGATSHLSPYLHFGHVSTHEVVCRVLEAADWNPTRDLGKPTGARSRWWGVSESAEQFLDQVVTWRELGFNRCAHQEAFDRFESLPEWAQRTLNEHAADPRPYRYALRHFEEATTHDPLWNAAQTQLVRDGTIHNYLRMLWGKKILEWSGSPREALDIMIELNNKYALDGRDPNSYNGIMWVLGRFDRPWPERPI